MKLAIITGGSKGLGQALVSFYLEQGWQVVEFSRSGEGAHSVPCDFADSREAATTMEHALSELAKHHYQEVVAVSNVGTLVPIGPVQETARERLVDNASTNFTSAILFMSIFAKYFQHQSCRKTLANITSGAARKPYAGWSLYCAGKAGMEHFIRAAAVEQEGWAAPITFINVDPGVMDTDMQLAIRSSCKALFPSYERFVSFKKQGKLRPPLDVAREIGQLLRQPLQGGERYALTTPSQEHVMQAADLQQNR